MYEQSVPACRTCGRQCTGTGMVPGWGILGGYTGWVIPGHPAPWKAEACTAKRAPEGPAGPWSGWYMLQRPPEHPDPPTPHPWCSGARFAGLGPLPASWPIRARFSQYFSKVSQNHGVSPKSMHEACHSPCFQNGLEKSALKILGFPFSLAFSHKELIGLFWPDPGVYVKTTKCRQNVHHCTRRGRTIPPRCHAASCPCDTAPHCAQRGTLFSASLPECA